MTEGNSTGEDSGSDAPVNDPAPDRDRDRSWSWGYTTPRDVETPYGDVEFETAVCSSCGEEVVAERATPFVIGDVAHERRVGSGPDSDSDYTRIMFHTDGLMRGWACDDCYDTAPIAYPGQWDLTTGDMKAIAEGVVVSGGAVLILLVVVVLLILTLL